MHFKLSLDPIMLGRERGQGNIHFPVWQPYPVDPYSVLIIMSDYCIHKSKTTYWYLYIEQV